MFGLVTLCLMDVAVTHVMTNTSVYGVFLLKCRIHVREVLLREKLL